MHCVMNKFRAGFLLSALLLCVPALFGSERIECNRLPSKILGHPVRYCVVLPASFDADKTRQFPVLYFLHGLGGNEQFAMESGTRNLLAEMPERGGVKDFSLATAGGGNPFYINLKRGTGR